MSVLDSNIYLYLYIERERGGHAVLVSVLNRNEQHLRFSPNFFFELYSSWLTNYWAISRSRIIAFNFTRAKTRMYFVGQEQVTDLNYLIFGIFVFMHVMWVWNGGKIFAVAFAYICNSYEHLKLLIVF